MVPAADCNWRAQIACNWAADPSGDGYCRSCAMTRTVPDLALEDNLRDLAATEAAKRWVLAGLHRWGWFGFADGGGKPVFDLVAEQTSDISSRRASRTARLASATLIVITPSAWPIVICAGPSDVCSATRSNTGLPPPSAKPNQPHRCSPASTQRFAASVAARSRRLSSSARSGTVRVIAQDRQ